MHSKILYSNYSFDNDNFVDVKSLSHITYYFKHSFPCKVNLPTCELYIYYVTFCHNSLMLIELRSYMYGRITFFNT